MLSLSKWLEGALWTYRELKSRVLLLSGDTELVGAGVCKRPLVQAVAANAYGSIVVNRDGHGKSKGYSDLGRSITKSLESFLKKSRLA